VVSDAADLVRHARLILDGGLTASGRRVLSTEAIGELSRPRTVGLPGGRTYEPCPWPTERSIGWAIGGPGERPSRATLWHSGASGTSVWVDPEHDVIVVLLTATWLLPAALLARVADIAMGSRDHDR